MYQDWPWSRFTEKVTSGLITIGSNITWYNVWHNMVTMKAEHGWESGPCFNIKTVFPGIGYSHYKDKTVMIPFIFMMGVPILIRWSLYIKMPHWNNSKHPISHTCGWAMGWGISNHQPHDCLLNHLFGRRSKKTSKLRVTGLCAGIHRGPVNSPHKWPVTRKMLPFDDVIMCIYENWLYYKGTLRYIAFLTKIWNNWPYRWVSAWKT